ncbi:16011_t:CDS:1, partial [Racocetra fulgida]
KYRQNLDDLVSSTDLGDKIIQRINEISQMSNIEDATCFIKSWYQEDDLFSEDLEASMLNFIRNLDEK